MSEFLSFFEFSKPYASISNYDNKKYRVFMQFMAKIAFFQFSYDILKNDFRLSFTKLPVAFVIQKTK